MINSILLWNPSVIPLLRVKRHMAPISSCQEPLAVDDQRDDHLLADGECGVQIRINPSSLFGVSPRQQPRDGGWVDFE